MIGCVADDYTGATDVASAFRRGGLRVSLTFGVPPANAEPPETDVAVVALKARTIPADEAVQASLAAHRWLAAHGATHTFFKVCSTFDSTDRGNIGPVADALANAIAAASTPVIDLVCPAAPRHGRTVYQGHLFVGDRLLSESSMRHHPLTPMTDSDLVRVLGGQTPQEVALLPHAVIRAGTDAAAAQLARMAASGVRHLIADAVSDEDLRTIVAAGLREEVLFTGAAGLAEAVACVSTPGSMTDGAEAPPLPEGPTVILTGSCSTATLEQIGRARVVMPAHRLDPASPRMAAEAAEFVARMARAPALLVASAFERADCRNATSRAAAIEEALADAARAAVAAGASRIIVAGGETSGAVVRCLGIGRVVVGAEEAPGVPWIITPDGKLALLLKSGNFGKPDLFLRAARVAA